MKKYVFLTLALVLTASMLVGCGCTNQNKGGMSEPTVLPTNEELWESTTFTTAPSTQTTMPSETYDRGNGPLEDMIPSGSGSTDSTENTEATGSTGTMEGRSRGMMPGSK
ncbi:MAG: hypothetical protein IJN67_12760 [Oscillospiraceae bacterium]|nr:hypothetical protein [Oscillospiraceae bacterium]